MEGRSEFLKQVEQHLVRILDNTSGVLQSVQLPSDLNSTHDETINEYPTNQTAMLNDYVDSYAENVNALSALLHEAIDQTPLPIQTKSSTSLKAFVVENLDEAVSLQKDFDPHMTQDPQQTPPTHAAN